MPTDASGSYDLEDPLHGYSYLSLFPRTCRTLSVVAKPTELSDLESVHNVLKTVGLKETSRHIEQARMILESCSEDTQSEVIVNAAVQKVVEGDGLVNDEIARKRRPGLGRKQAKFNFIRRISQPAVISEPKLDITKLEDPEEFFLAHERFENAKKELRKHSGILPEADVDINDISFTARPRRPGIPGRLKATYKHNRPSVVSNDDVFKESYVEKAENGLTSASLPPPESLVLSQENSKEIHRSPVDKNTLPEATDSIKDGVLGGLISKVNGFLDEILSGTYDHLNSEGQLNILQEQLQIKPINIDNLSLLKLPDIPKYDFKISGNFSKPRKSIRDVRAAFTGINTKTPAKSMLTPGSVHFSASSTPPKSPFASWSSLKKHITQSNSSKYSFSDFNTIPCSVGGSSPANCADTQPDSVEVQGDSRSKFKVFTYDEDMAAVSTKSPNHELLKGSGGFPDPIDYISTTIARASTIMSTKSSSAVDDENGAPNEPQSTAEYYEGSSSNEPSGTQMQSGSATVPPSSEHDPCLADLQSSPEAGESQGKHWSTISNLHSAQHEDIQVEGDIKISKKMRQKTVPMHKTTIVHPQKDGIAADATDAREQEPSRVEVQAERVSMEAISMQPESIDNSRSLAVKLHEKQSELPDIGLALENVPVVHEMSKKFKRKGKSGPVPEVRKKQKRKYGVSRKRNDTVAMAKESVSNQCLFTRAELHVNQSEIPNNHPEQHEELMDGNIPKASLNKKSQAKDISSLDQMEHTEEVIHPSKKAKRKELSLRKSIAVAGTSFQSGVRRSTRFRMRPLEFWRGERYLYGRLEPESTLPTLIGIKKYLTPAKKEGKAILQVQDRVDSKKYRELIDLAARH